jgi:dTDP-4-dehydrorhamnose reductase
VVRRTDQVVNARGQVIVLGADGQLGGQMVAGLGPMTEWEVHGWDLPQIDITNDAALQRLIRDAQPHWIVDCAAMTHVDGCEARPDEANSANAEPVRRMADICNDVGATLLRISTDFVFDGCSRRPYREDDPANPLGAYARSKYQGKQYARTCDRHLIVRTAWLYAAGANNFVNTILTWARAGATARQQNERTNIAQPMRLDIGIMKLPITRSVCMPRVVLITAAIR